MTSSGVCSVRRAGVDDWRELRAIRLEALADTPEAYSSTFEESSAWPDGRWQLMADQWTFFLAERDGRTIGMASGGLNEQYPGTRWLYGMYVTGAERGSDAASRLVAAVVAWARDQGVEALYLNVTTLVPRARAFYEKVGFRSTGEVNPLDRDPSVNLVNMVRELD